MSYGTGLLRCRECDCLWRDNGDYSVSLASPAQKSCSVCEAKTSHQTCDIFPREPMLTWFLYGHLPPHLQETSKLFGELALQLAVTVTPGPERTVAFRKLLEAKDAAVRAKLEPGG
jgi:hypothetical protein